MLTIYLNSKEVESYVSFYLHQKDTDIERVKDSILSFAKRNEAVFTFTAGQKIFITYKNYEAMMTCASWLAWLAF
ncbi:hypothetical protein IKE96_02995 [bacterium]|nr:hypothetical protein [bacterium]